jgi:hypothetical protein
MAQILCWDVDYQPSLKPWSTVKCTDRKKVSDYLQQDSIILASGDIWNNAEYRQFLILAKVHFPNVQLGIIVSRKKKGNSLVSFLKASDLEDFIKRLMRRQFKLVDHKKIVEEGEKELRIKS